jgi:hypothetical protein
LNTGDRSSGPPDVALGGLVLFPLRSHDADVFLSRVLPSKMAGTQAEHGGNNGGQKRSG